MPHGCLNGVNGGERVAPVCLRAVLRLYKGMLPVVHPIFPFFLPEELRDLCAEVLLTLTPHEANSLSSYLTQALSLP